MRSMRFLQKYSERVRDHNSGHRPEVNEGTAPGEKGQSSVDHKATGLIQHNLDVAL